MVRSKKGSRVDTKFPVLQKGNFFSILTLPCGPRFLGGLYDRFDETMRALD
jgi:hypothetical protein